MDIDGVTRYAALPFCIVRTSCLSTAYILTRRLPTSHRRRSRLNAVTYGYVPHAASMRVRSPPSVPPLSSCLEVRAPGAAVGPQFAVGAVFVLGLVGIRN